MILFFFFGMIIIIVDFNFNFRIIFSFLSKNLDEFFN